MLLTALTSYGTARSAVATLERARKATSAARQLAGSPVSPAILRKAQHHGRDGTSLEGAEYQMSELVAVMGAQVVELRADRLLVPVRWGGRAGVGYGLERFEKSRSRLTATNSSEKQFRLVK
jgi:hypothetical protein